MGVQGRTRLRCVPAEAALRVCPAEVYLCAEARVAILFVLKCDCIDNLDHLLGRDVGCSTGLSLATAAPSTVSAAAAAATMVATRPVERKGEHVTDVAVSGEQHRQPVDPDPEPDRGRQPILQRRAERLVWHRT